MQENQNACLPDFEQTIFMCTTAHNHLQNLEDIRPHLKNWGLRSQRMQR